MRVLVAMSGGVDSSVAAALLVEAGHDVTGATLKLWGGEQDSGCCAAADVEDARRVAAQLGVPHYVFNLVDDFTAAVVEPYVDAYARGETPNPCIECNRSIKWGRLGTRAQRLGFDAVATGHHARIVATAAGPRLARGRDLGKDQSYVLSMLDAAALARTLLPVGALTKSEVRDHAARLGLRTATKPESMDVCFITKGGRGAFVEQRLGARHGVVVDTNGNPIGEHRGVAHFTIGQRRGIGVTGRERRFVVDLDASAQRVVIGRREELLRDVIILREVSYAGGTRPSPDEPLRAQSRAHGDAVACTLRGERLCFVEPQPRVAPGQTVALYDRDDEQVVGSAVAAR